MLGEIVRNEDEGSEDIDLCTAGNMDDGGPSRIVVGDREGITMIPGCLPSVMAHEVYLHVSRNSSREFPEGDHRDEGKETPGLGPGTMPPVVPLCLLCPE